MSGKAIAMSSVQMIGGAIILVAVLMSRPV
jgi:hypothetical protein